MRCGKACFGQKGQKTPKIENFGLKVCPLGPRGVAHGPRRAASWDLEVLWHRHAMSFQKSQKSRDYIFENPGIKIMKKKKCSPARA